MYNDYYIRNIVMIYIEKGQENKVVLTLTESSTITSPYFLFKFENEFNTSSTPLYWSPLDQSSYPERYNLFILDEPSDLNLIIGQYSYRVYESETPIVVTPSTSEEGLTELEEGRMQVIGTSTSIYD